MYDNFFKIFIVIQLQLSAFSPHPSTPPQPNSPPSPASTLPLDFVHVSFIVVPVNPSSHCPLPTPLWLLLDCTELQFFSSFVIFQIKIRFQRVSFLFYSFHQAGHFVNINFVIYFMFILCIVVGLFVFLTSLINFTNIYY